LLLALEGYGIDAATLSYFDLSLITGNASDSTYVYNENGDANNDENQDDNNNVIYPKFSSSEGQLFGVSADGGGDGGISLLVSCSMCDARCANYTAQGDDEQQDQQDEQEQEEDIDYAEWAQTLSECMATESFLDDEDETYPLYAGWMCNANHKRIKPVMFLDDACTIFELDKDYATVMNGTEYEYTINGANTYMKTLIKESFPLYQTPTPMSWADAFTNAETIAEFAEALGTDEIEQQYYEEMENAEENGGQDNENGDTYYEDLWWQALFESWNLADAVDEDLTTAVAEAIDLTTCEGTYGQVAYNDEDGNELFYNASSVLYVNGEGGGDDSIMAAACSIVYAMAGDYSSINLVASAAYYEEEEAAEDDDDYVANTNNGKVVYVEKNKTVKISREGKIVMIVLATILGVFCSLWMVHRCCYAKKAPESIKDKQKPLIEEEAAEPEENANAISA
jgi:hypothetical protein